MSAHAEYGVQVHRPTRPPVTYPAASLAEAREIREDWAADPHDGATYTVVFRTVSDWAPVDPTEVTR